MLIYIPSLLDRNTTSTNIALMSFSLKINVAIKYIWTNILILFLQDCCNKEYISSKDCHNLYFLLLIYEHTWSLLEKEFHQRWVLLLTHVTTYLVGYKMTVFQSFICIFLITSEFEHNFIYLGHLDLFFYGYIFIFAHGFVCLFFFLAHF